MDLGRQLAPLRDEGVLIIGSGNIVHNLRAVDFGHDETGFDWAQRFDERAREVLQTNPSDHRVGWNTEITISPFRPLTHYLPMLYIAGLANDQPLELLVDGHVAGSISMAAYTLGMSQRPNHDGSSHLAPNFLIFQLPSAITDLPLSTNDVGVDFAVPRRADSFILHNSFFGCGAWAIAYVDHFTLIRP